MNLLALDTSSIACSAAALAGDAVAERHEERAREHTRIIMPMIAAVLDELDLDADHLDAIVLGNGPGSFIGLRIAASIAQGLAHGAGIGVVPVSSMAAVAAQVIAEEGADRVAVCQDAHMSETYLGLYERDEAGLPRATADERLHGQDEIAELRDAGFVAAGYGWRRYPALLAANERLLAGVSAIEHPRARYLLASGRAAHAKGEAVEPQDLEPAYLRRKVAATPGRGGS